MMKAIKRILTVLIVFFFLIPGCSSLKRGIILEKKYSAPRTIYANGVYNQRPARYQIIVKGKTTKGKLVKRKVYVGKQTYDSLELGEIFMF